MYEKLHSALVAAMSQEKQLLGQAKQLANDAEVCQPSTCQELSVLQA